MMPSVIILDDRHHPRPTGADILDLYRETRDLEAERLGDLVQVAEPFDMAIFFFTAEKVRRPQERGVLGPVKIVKHALVGPVKSQEIHADDLDPLADKPIR